ncbi:hypothetical protein PRUB_b0878 [Pseudoalteromonas rubra]|uniref:Lipoprotein n=1 Tax=Pseudoalteromonas rubra TaxID=43658 RepID=A0A8T0C2Z5_9GAMM|nr:hypothetical protein [Pseudoalteromonas rubra]KAF7781601.1 hypothetical protein PRUB_b0878 [Pseudoalteromonas rubra]
MNSFKFSILALACSTLLACSTETTDSENVKTEAIWSKIYVTTTGETSRVIAELNVDGPNGNNIKLTANDKLVARAANISQVMSEDEELFDVDYRAIFDVTSGGTQFTVDFTRGSENKTLTTTMNLPRPFNIITPQKNQSFSVNDELTLAWTPGTEDDTTFSSKLTIECKRNDGNSFFVNINNEKLTDDGTQVFDLSTIEALKDTAINTRQECSAEFYLARTRAGTVDPSYASGSSAKAVQERYSDKFEIRLRD